MIQISAALKRGEKTMQVRCLQCSICTRNLPMTRLLYRAPCVISSFANSFCCMHRGRNIFSE